MAAPGVTIVKSFTYRGNVEEWSNQYHFVGTSPTTDSAWTSLINSLVSLEYLCLTSLVSYVRAYGYHDTDDDAVFVYNDLGGTGPHSTGSLSVSSAYLAPGDAACWVRWKTSRLTSKGKPIYLRKYFHSVILAGDTSDNYDHISSAQTSALTTFGTAVNGVSSAWPGIAGPDGTAPGASSVSPFVTTRTLKRRGPRPH